MKKLGCATSGSCPLGPKVCARGMPLRRQCEDAPATRAAGLQAEALQARLCISRSIPYVWIFCGRRVGPGASAPLGGKSWRPYETTAAPPRLRIPAPRDKSPCPDADADASEGRTGRRCVGTSLRLDGPPPLVALSSRLSLSGWWYVFCSSLIWQVNGGWKRRGRSLSRAIAASASLPSLSLAAKTHQPQSHENLWGSRTEVLKYTGGTHSVGAAQSHV